MALVQVPTIELVVLTENKEIALQFIYKSQKSQSYNRLYNNNNNNKIIGFKVSRHGALVLDAGRGLEYGVILDVHND